MIEAMQRVKERLLRLHLETGLDHLGSAQSCFEMMSLLFLETMSPDDEFILSKGHAVSLLYACLAETGKLSEDDFKKAMRPGGLPAHPPSRMLYSGISYGSGSLGHGFPVATGMALARKIKKQPGQIYCLISDGECNEGSIWEAALFASHHKLDNLTLLLDRNRWQCMGATEEVLALEPISNKWKAFGFEVLEVENGHDLTQLRLALAQSQKSVSPRLILAHTIKAHGLPQYYDQVESHYFRLSEDDFQKLSSASSEEAKL